MDLAGQVRDPLEVVPEADELFVFVGKPPKQFGVVRFHSDGEENLIQRMRSSGLSPIRIQEISDEARAAYLEHEAAPRYAHQVGKRAITVIESEGLGEKLDGVFAAIEN